MRISDLSSDVCSSDLGRRYADRDQRDLADQLWMLVEQLLERTEFFQRALGVVEPFDRQDQALTLQRCTKIGHALLHILTCECFGDAIHVDADRMCAEADMTIADRRSDERRVWKEWVSTCRSRWSPSH